MGLPLAGAEQRSDETACNSLPAELGKDLDVEQVDDPIGTTKPGKNGCHHFSPITEPGLERDRRSDDADVARRAEAFPFSVVSPSTRLPWSGDVALRGRYLPNLPPCGQRATGGERQAGPIDVVTLDGDHLAPSRGCSLGVRSAMTTVTTVSKTQNADRTATVALATSRLATPKTNVAAKRQRKAQSSASWRTCSAELTTSRGPPWSARATCERTSRSPQRRPPISRPDPV